MAPNVRKLAAAHQRRMWVDRSKRMASKKLELSVSVYNREYCLGRRKRSQSTHLQFQATDTSLYPTMDPTIPSCDSNFRTKWSNDFAFFPTVCSLSSVPDPLDRQASMSHPSKLSFHDQPFRKRFCNHSIASPMLQN